ncbi:MAG: glycosyltransferase family 2 protein [Chloroflexi bacterium]|nr:glycosyltransferase family 2 protein [Chloroflexota bacterium]
MKVNFREACPPILFVIFNRPDLTQQVFARIREAKPAQLFIAADGPRADHSDDVNLCAEARSVVEQVDWTCEVRTLFRETNLGCKNGVSTAIDWFFEHVESGIILEDDCVPDLTFFRYCSELLDRYCDDERIMIISGNNFQQGIQRTHYSYFYSHFLHIWGWATWRRAWQHYDGKLKHWPALRDTSWLLDIHGSKAAAVYWQGNFDKAYTGEVDTWCYPWLYSAWEQNGLAISPEINLVSNIGFDERATHTKSASHKLTNLPTMTIQFPLRHPPLVVCNVAADQFTLRTLYLPPPAPSLNKRVIRKVKNIANSALAKTGFRK